MVCVILHEFCHYRRDIVDNITDIYNSDDEDEIFDVMLKEEKLADIYANFVYLLLFDEIGHEALVNRFEDGRMVAKLKQVSKEISEKNIEGVKEMINQ